MGHIEGTEVVISTGRIGDDSIVDFCTYSQHVAWRFSLMRVAWAYLDPNGHRDLHNTVRWQKHAEIGFTAQAFFANWVTVRHVALL